MPTTEPQTVQQNIADVPLYTFLDAAQYLHLPTWAVVAMSGRGGPQSEWYLHGGWGDGFPSDGDAPSERLSFHQLADYFVRGAELRAWEESRQHKRGGTRPSFRCFERLWFALEDEYPALDIFDPAANDEWVQRDHKRVPELDAVRLAKLRLLHLERIELAEGVPARLYPFSRDPAPDSPRAIVLDPHVRFGRPTLAGRGLPTDVLIERFRAGDSVPDLAEDYDITTAEVDEAIRYETRLPVPLFIPSFEW